MHWVLTILVMFSSGAALTHEEYQNECLCQQAAAVIAQQHREQRSYGQTLLTCTRQDNSLEATED
jgi:hypothetical protein